MSGSPSSAAHRVYHNDVIVQTLVKHLSPKTLVSVMMVEQQGDLFDLCVKELYREVKVKAIEDKNRDMERHCKYLDAVRRLSHPLYTPRVHTARGSFVDQVTSAEVLDPLRRKCPGLRSITDWDQWSGVYRYELNFTPGEPSGTIRLHDEGYVWLPWYQSVPSVKPLATSNGWEIEQTATFRIGRRYASQYKRISSAAASTFSTLDPSCTELKVMAMELNISQLTHAVESRVAGRKRITKIHAWVESFSFEELADLATKAGNDLRELCLTTSNGVNPISVTALPQLVALFRAHCPHLRQLRLPLSFDTGKKRCESADIPLPPSTITITGSELEPFVIYLDTWSEGRLNQGKSSAELLFPYSFAFNMACLLGVDGYFQLAGADAHGMHCETSVDHGPLSSRFGDINTAIRFFKRLDSMLEPHFRVPSLEHLAHLGISSMRDLNVMQYHTDGTPMGLVESRWVGEQKRLAVLGLRAPPHPKTARLDNFLDADWAYPEASPQDEAVRTNDGSEDDHHRHPHASTASIVDDNGNNEYRHRRKRVRRGDRWNAEAGARGR